jgi:hypothetical protein
MILSPRIALASALILGAHGAAAQEPKLPTPNAQPKQAQMTIEATTLVILIRGAIMALQQANQTGNYSVLRDLGTPVFRERFDQTGLAMAFANLRARKVNLSPALVIAPNLSKNPGLDKNGELVLVGDFLTQPLRIHFELAYLQLDGLWRLSGIAVDALPPANAGQASAAPETPRAAQAGSGSVAKKRAEVRP